MGDSLTEAGLNFQNLPLLESAVRASFQAPTTLSYDLVLQVHQALRDTFPLLREPRQVEVAPGYGPTPTEFGPGLLPGAVYEGDRSGVVVSLHPQLIVARWVKQFGVHEPPYPRYRALRDALWKGVAAFRRVASEAFPGVAVVNMSYVNFVVPKVAETPVLRFLSEQAQPTLIAGGARTRKLEASWAERDGIDIRFALEEATLAVSQRKTDGYRLTTAAGLRLSETLDASSALDRIHGRLQTFFLDLISPDAKTEWGLEV
jgi:uncharacterized protein (TIGR04255 family)